MRLIAMLFCVLGWLFAGCAERDSTAAPRTGRYSLALTSHAEMPRGAAPFDVALKAELVLAPGAQAEWLEARLEKPRFDASIEQSADFARLSRELERPFAVRFEEGRVVEHRFEAGLGAFAAALLRSIIATLQLPHGSSSSAAVREWDSTGEYEARYRRTARGFEKQKLRYLRLLGAPQGGRMQLPEVSHAQLELSFEGAELARVVSRETVRSPLLQDAAIDVDTRIELVRVGPAPLLASSAGKAVRAEQPYLDPTPRAAFDRARADGRDAAALIAALEAEQRAADDMLGSVNGQAVPAATRDSREKALGSRLATFSSLVGVLRADETAAASVLAAIAAGSRAEPSLMSALVSSGRTAGLIALARDAGMALERRRAAVSALLRNDRPSAADCALLLSLLPDPDFEEHARFGLGSFARRLREQGQAQRAEELVAPLFAELATATAERQRVTLLRALANAASPAALPAVSGDLESESRALREAAIHALAMVPGTDVDAVYARRLAAERDAQLRELILGRIAQHRAASPVLVAALERLLRDDAMAVHRTSAQRALSAMQGRERSSTREPV
jgi:hypothetical protein